MALGWQIGLYARACHLFNPIPEGFASILYKDVSKAETAANDMKLTAQDLYQFGIIDGIIEEPYGGAHNDYDYVIGKVREVIDLDLKELMGLSV